MFHTMTCKEEVRWRFVDSEDIFGRDIRKSKYILKCITFMLILEHHKWIYASYGYGIIMFCIDFIVLFLNHKSQYWFTLRLNCISYNMTSNYFVSNMNLSLMLFKNKCQESLKKHLNFKNYDDPYNYFCDMFGLGTFKLGGKN